MTNDHHGNDCHDDVKTINMVIVNLYFTDNNNPKDYDDNDHVDHDDQVDHVDHKY